MSELKPYIGPHPTDHTLTEYYLKSEADKVIAELEEKHFNDLQSAEDSFKSILELNRKELRHHKYKRCVAMVKYCDMGLTYYNEKFDSFSCERADFFYKWYNRWWELAKKFKEAK